MAIAVIMPKAGMAMEEGTVVQWLRNVGDTIEKGEVILEIETDKVSMEVEAEVGGTLIEILASEGDVVPVTQTIAYIGAPGEVVGGATKPPTGRLKEQRKHQTTAPPGTAGTQRAAGGHNIRVLATPAAKRRAGELGIDLTTTKPTGRGGQVTLLDVENAHQRISAAQTPLHPPAPPSESPTAASPLAKRLADMRGLELSGISGSGPNGLILAGDLPADTEETKQLSGIRKAAARAMMASHEVIPPVTLHAVCDVTALLDALSAYKTRHPDPPRINDVFVKATGYALKSCPWMTVRLVGDEITHASTINIGVAVSLPEGLIVPVLRDPNALSLEEIHILVRDLVNRARNRSLSAEDLDGAVFTITNLGMHGITTFTPIIPLPQSAILGIGAVAEKLRLANGQVEQYSELPLSLTIDHRLIDGAQGALFLSAFKALLEAPESIR